MMWVTVTTLRRFGYTQITILWSDIPFCEFEMFKLNVQNYRKPEVYHNHVIDKAMFPGFKLWSCSPKLSLGCLWYNSWFEECYVRN